MSNCKYLDGGLKYWVILVFFITVFLTGIVEPAQATREPSKSTMYQFYAEGGPDGTWNIDLGEPASIYRVDFGDTYWGFRNATTHIQLTSPSTYPTIRYGKINYYDKESQLTYSGWDSVSGIVYLLNNDQGHSSYTYSWYDNVAATEEMKMEVYWYTYTITPSEYNYDIYTNLSTGQKGIRVNWRMVNEPNYIEYQVHNVTTGQYSPWIVGNKTQYNWIDYSITGGNQYAYEIIIRQQRQQKPVAYTPSKNITIGTCNPDLSAPSISSFTINNGSTYACSRNVTLNITANDNVGVTHLRLSTDGTNWTAWEAFNANRAYTLPTTTNGNHSVYVQVKDAMSNLSNIASDTIFLDTVNPSGSFAVNNGADYVNSENVTLVLNATDASPSSGVASVQISNELTFTGRPWDTFSGNKTWSIPSGEGSKTIYLRYRDGAGNMSPTYNKTITLDKTPPTGSLDIQSKDGLPKTFSPEVLLYLTGTDTLSGIKGVQVSNNGTSWSSIMPLTSPMEWSLSPGGGAKTVYARIIDNAGNITLVSDDIAYAEDSIQPTVNLSINNGAVSTTSGDVTLNISAYDNITLNKDLKMALSNDNVTWTPWEALNETKAWSITTGYGATDIPGTKTVFIKVADAESNTGYDRCSIGYNTTAPALDEPGVEVVGAEVIEIDGKKTYVTKSNALAMKLPFTNISTIRTALANGTWGEWMAYTDTTDVLTGLGEGITGVKVQAKDQHGVVSDVYTIRILVDYSPPVIDSLKTVNNATAATTSIGIVVDATDNHCNELMCSYDGGIVWIKLTDTNISVPVYGGVNNIKIQVRDYAKNIASKTISVWGL